MEIGLYLKDSYKEGVVNCLNFNITNFQHIQGLT